MTYTSSRCLALRGTPIIIGLGVALGALMQGGARLSGPVATSPPAPLEEPYLIPLRRELYPVKRGGKVVSYKASYSGIIHAGYPRPQQFRVVFDTGSGHVILPSIECKTDACIRHQRYDISNSETAEAIMMDGSAIQPDQLTDQVTIGFGTGRITGEFVRERVCLGPVPSNNDDQPVVPQPCLDTQIVVAIEMSKRPFELFDFDGILGLGLRSLAISNNFSFFNLLTESNKYRSPHFGVFLAEGDTGEESEIAIGGHNPRRLVEPLSWVPMAKPELGYWQVEIVAFRIDGHKLDICKDEKCFGILDTGTSHLGIPADFNNEVADLLTRDAGDVKDCRLSQAPTIDIELKTLNLTLHPKSYMRTLPLSEDIMVDTNVGVSPTSYLNSASNDSENASLTEHAPDDNATAPPRILCTPKLLPVSWPAPLGPNLFILGEPVLHRYYTVFDWAGLRAGFGLAARKTEEASPVPPKDEIIMIQVTVTVRKAARAGTKRLALP